MDDALMWRLIVSGGSVLLLLLLAAVCAIAEHRDRKG